jgi:hypothetical protein
MIDRLDTSIARADQPLDIPASQSPPPPPPPVALEYQPPQPRAARRGDMVWGVAISVLIANGVGWMLFGMLMMSNVRDDYAGPVAVGAAFIVLGVGIAASLAWTRRQQQIPAQQHHPR